MKRPLLTAVMAALVALAGTAVADETAAPYFVFEAASVGQDLIGLVPEGLRFDGHSRGVISDGLLVGAWTTATDYLLYRHDGVGVLDIRGFAAHPDGVTLAMTLKGFLGAPMPGMLEAMLAPAFFPPDVDIPLHGAAWFQTMAPEYAFLNHTVFGCTGTYNPGKGVGRTTCRSLAP